MDGPMKAYSQKEWVFCFRPLRLTPHDLRLRMTLCSMFTRRSLGVGGPARSEPWRRWALPVLRSPARRDGGGCDILR